jgi:hypothetical protein
MFARSSRRTEGDGAAVRFVQCEHCSYDFLTDTGDRSCHYYECPYLPEAIDVWCPTCHYNFATRDGNPECGDNPKCDFAVRVAPGRVKALRDWVAAQA